MTDYRTWTREVRREARERLRELQRDRLARRGAPLPPEEETPAAPAALPMAVSRRSLDMLTRPGTPPEETSGAEDLGATVFISSRAKAAPMEGMVEPPEEVQGIEPGFGGGAEETPDVDPVPEMEEFDPGAEVSTKMDGMPAPVIDGSEAMEKGTGIPIEEAAGSVGEAVPASPDMEEACDPEPMPETVAEDLEEIGDPDEADGTPAVNPNIAPLVEDVVEGMLAPVDVPPDPEPMLDIEEDGAGAIEIDDADRDMDVSPEITAKEGSALGVEEASGDPEAPCPEPAFTEDDEDADMASAMAAAGPTPETGMPGTDAAARSDLAELPGAGAGLVWMLGQCGIHSLADLAGADAGRLREDLGLVGRLLDLESWIAFARGDASQVDSRAG